MQFNKPLIRGVLQKRYKRFLADIDFGEQQFTTVHCPNTGAMTGCAEPGFIAYCSDSDNPKRKYRYTWELSVNGNNEWIVVNTQRANQLAGTALKTGFIPELANITEWQAEQKYGEHNSRIDWLGHANDGQQCFVEVKSVTLHDHGLGYFPDAVSTRGQKHLNELILMRQAGQRAVMLFVVMHTGINEVRPASHIDPKYAQLCIQAAELGVEFYAVKTHISDAKIELDRVVRFQLR